MCVCTTICIHACADVLAHTHVHAHSYTNTCTLTQSNICMHIALHPCAGNLATTSKLIKKARKRALHKFVCHGIVFPPDAVTV